MKKSLWGYSVKEANEFITTLQSQNEELAKKVTTLSGNVKTLNEQISNSSKTQVPLEKVEQIKKQVEEATRANQAMINQKKAENEALTEEINNLKSENTILANELTTVLAQKNIQNDDEELKAEILRLKEENSQLTLQLKNSEIKTEVKVEEKIETKTENPYDAVGGICKKAYEDMDKMKRETALEIDNRVNEFASTVEKTNEEMNAVIGEISAIYDTIVGDLENSTQEIIEKLKFLNVAGATIKASLVSVEDISENFKSLVPDFNKPQKATIKSLVKQDVELATK